MPLVEFSNGAVADANDVNANFALCVLTDTARTVTVTHDWNAAQDFAPGTVSLPGVYLNGDTDTGLYQIGVNNLGIACNGAKVLDIGTAGLGVTGTLDVSDATTLSSTLAVTGAATFGSTLQVASDLMSTASNFDIRTNTSSGSDGHAVRVSGAGAVDVSRGAYLQLNGADRSTNPGQAFLRGGNNQGVTIGGGATTLEDDLSVAGNTVLDGSLSWGGGSVIATSDDIANMVTLDPLYLSNVAQSSSTQCVRNAGADQSTFLTYMIRAGSITGIVGRLSGTITAGTITLEVYKNGVATGFSISFTSADGADPVKAGTQATGTDTFVAGDYLELYAIGDGTLAPATVDVIYAAMEIAYA